MFFHIFCQLWQSGFPRCNLGQIWMRVQTETCLDRRHINALMTQQHTKGFDALIMVTQKNPEKDCLLSGQHIIRIRQTLSRYVCVS